MVKISNDKLESYKYDDGYEMNNTFSNDNGKIIGR